MEFIHEQGVRGGAIKSYPMGAHSSLTLIDDIVKVDLRCDALF